MPKSRPRRFDFLRLATVVGCAALVVAPIVGSVGLVWHRGELDFRPVSTVEGIPTLLSITDPGVRAIRRASLPSDWMQSEFLYRIECDACAFADLVLREGMSPRSDAVLRARFVALAPEWFASVSRPAEVFARSDFDPDGAGTNWGEAALCFDPTRSEMLVWLKRTHAPD